MHPHNGHRVEIELVEPARATWEEEQKMDVHCATSLLFQCKYELRSIVRHESWQVIIVRRESLLRRAAHCRSNTQRRYM